MALKRKKCRRTPYATRDAAIGYSPDRDATKVFKCARKDCRAWHIDPKFTAKPPKPKPKPRYTYLQAQAAAFGRWLKPVTEEQLRQRRLDASARAHRRWALHRERMLPEKKGYL